MPSLHRLGDLLLPSGRRLSVLQPEEMALLTPRMALEVSPSPDQTVTLTWPGTLCMGTC